MDGWTNGSMDGSMDGPMDGLTHGRAHGRTDPWTDPMDGPMDGLTHGRTLWTGFMVGWMGDHRLRGPTPSDRLCGPSRGTGTQVWGDEARKRQSTSL